ncbi:MAG: hypothetical protein AB7T49_05910 [Oligoflexales bacterium]
MKTTVFFASLLVSQMSFAQGMFCVNDRTPIDGLRTTIAVVANDSQTYDVTLSTYNPWSGEVKKDVIATNLPCEQEGLYFTCQRGRAEGETINSGFTTTEVTTKALVPGHGIVSSVAIEMTVYSDKAVELDIAHKPIAFVLGEGIMAAKCELLSELR